MGTKTKKKVVTVEIDQDDIDSVTVEQTECCGVFEISGLQDNPWAVIFSLKEELRRDYNLVIFHDAVDYHRGEKLARLIKKYSLGTLIKTKKVMNPNTCRLIQMWVMYPNWKVIRAIVDGAVEGKSYNSVMIKL